MFFIEIDKGEFVNMKQVTRFALRTTIYGSSVECAVITFWMIDGSTVQCNPKLTQYLYKILKPMVSNHIKDIQDPKTIYCGMDSLTTIKELQSSQEG